MFFIRDSKYGTGTDPACTRQTAAVLIVCAVMLLIPAFGAAADS